MENRSLNKVLLSSGGTGGHIFPAIAVANEIKKRFPSCEILFVGAEGKMEMENSWWFVSFKIPWPRPLASRTCQRTFPEPYKVNLIR